MADRVSIIRFKIDGIQGASSALDQFSRQVLSQQAIMERSAKAIQQIQLGQTLPGADLGKLRENLDKQQAIHAAAEQRVQQAISDIQFKAGNDRFAVEQRLLDRSKAERIAQISAAVPDEARRQQLISSAEQIHQLATAEIAQKKAAAELADAIAGPGAAKRQRAEEWAEVFAGQDEARQKALESAGREKRARIDEWANVFAGQDEARQKAEERAVKRAADNAKARRDRFLKQLKEEESFSGALSGFGGKMILAHAAGTVGGDIIGDRHGGQEIGSIVGAAAFGGPAVAAAVAGLELIGSGFRAQRESVEAARKSIDAYGQSLSKMVDQWSGFTTSLVNQSHFGGEMEKVMKQASTAATAAASEIAKVETEGPGVSDAVNVLLGNTPAYVTQIDALERQKELGKAEYQRAKTERDAEYEKHLADQRNIDTAQNQLGSLSTMAPGAARERAELTAQLDLEKAQRDAAARERRDQAETGLREARAQFKELSELAANAPRGTDKEKAEAEALAERADAAQRKVKEAEAAVPRIQAENARVEAQANRNAESRQKGLEAQQSRQQSREVESKLAAVDPHVAMIADVREYNDLIVAGATAEQATAIQTAKYTLQSKQEAINAASARRSITLEEAEVQRAMLADQRSYNDESVAAAIKQSVAAKERAANEEEIAQLRLSAEESVLRIQYEEHRITLQEYETRKAILASRRAQESPEVAAAHTAEVAAKEDAANAEAIAHERLSAEQSILDVMYEQHRISTLEYEQAKALAADRRAQENPAVAAALERSVKARDEAETVKDVMRYRHEADLADLDLRVKRHQISERDADIERAILNDRRAQEPGERGDRIRKEIIALADARQKLRDQEILESGEFSTKYTAGHVNFGALNFNHPYGFYRDNARDNGFGTGHLAPDRATASNIPSGVREWLERHVEESPAASPDEANEDRKSEGSGSTEANRLLGEILRSLQRQEQTALH